MRLHDLPDGQTIDLDRITRVGPVVICKHDRQFDNYEVYFDVGESINIMVSALSREEFMNVLSGVA